MNSFDHLLCDVLFMILYTKAAAFMHRFCELWSTGLPALWPNKPAAWGFHPTVAPLGGPDGPHQAMDSWTLALDRQLCCYGTLNEQNNWEVGLHALKECVILIIRTILLVNVLFCIQERIVVLINSWGPMF